MSSADASSGPAETPTVYIVGTCDTKLAALLSLRSHLLSLSVDPVLVDTGVHPSADPGVGIPQSVLLSFLPDPCTLTSTTPRSEATALITGALTHLLRAHHAVHRVHAVLAIGGSQGTLLAARAMREALPVGFPKLIVSTMASGDVRSFVGGDDVTLMYSVVDIAGDNPVLRKVLANAAGAAAGMARVQFRRGAEEGGGTGESARRRAVAVSMFGVTTPAADAARAYLERGGYEVYVFHATGSGGLSLESLVRAGDVSGVLDLTTTELADEAFDGVLSAGPTRLTGAVSRKLPQVVSLGALDMVNFGPRSTVPPQYQHRRLFEHNAAVTLMRTSKQECARLGATLASRLSGASSGTCEVWVPLDGWSALDAEGAPFWDPEADRELVGALKAALGVSKVVVREVGAHINDGGFAERMAERLVQMMRETEKETDTAGG